MKVELRKVKIHKDMSEETTSYSAEVWLDGVKAGDVRNDGRGGCDMLSPPRLDEVLGAYAKTLPTRPYCGQPDYQPTWETVLADALDLFIARRDFERAIGKRVLFIDAKGLVRLTKTMPADKLPNAVTHWVSQGEKVLNALPRDEAFARYYAATCPDENRPEALKAVAALGGELVANVAAAIAAYDAATPDAEHVTRGDKPCDCQRCMIAETIGVGAPKRAKGGS